MIGGLVPGPAGQNVLADLLPVGFADPGPVGPICLRDRIGFGRSGAPTLAPGGIAFLDGPAWGEWDGALAVAMLKTSQIVLMKLSADGRSVTDTATILRDEHGRLRSITAEPDGS